MEEILQQLTSYLRAVWRRRWYTAGIAWFVCIVGWGGVVALPDQYEANAKVYVDTQSILRPLLSGLTAESTSDVRQQVELIGKTLLTRPNMEKLMSMTDLDIRADSAEDKEAMVADLQRRISFQRDQGGPDLYLVSYRGDDPQTAQHVVQSLLTIFMESSLGENRKTSDVATQFLEQQIKDYEAKLAESETKLKDFKQRNVGRMPGEDGDYFTRLQEAMRELEESNSQYEEAKHRRDELKRQLQQQEFEPMFALRDTDTPAPSNADEPSPLDARIQGLEAKLDSLMPRYTPQHPEVVQLTAIINDLKAQREAERKQRAETRPKKPAVQTAAVPMNPAYLQLKTFLASEEANLASIGARVSQSRQKVAMLRSQLGAVPEVEAEYTALTRDYDVYKRNYQQLLERRESAKLGQQVDTAGEKVSFKVVEPPVVPVEPVGPKRVLFASVVWVLGLFAGIGFAVATAILRPTFDTPRALIDATHLPVLGEIGLHLSPEQLRRKRINKMAFFGAMGLLCIAYGGLLGLLLVVGNVTKLLPI